MEVSKVLSNIFNELVSSTEKLSQEELEAIANGDFKIDLKIKVARKNKQNVSLLSNDDMKIILKQIESCISREEALQFIDKKPKRELEEIAGYLDIAYLKSDKVESIKHKIIEYSVGTILRSNAIQGT
jgi:Glu-tRNA(Gln) amidotransferase subunit E-like FAD-binding protein